MVNWLDLGIPQTEFDMQERVFSWVVVGLVVIMFGSCVKSMGECQYAKAQEESELIHQYCM